MRNYITSYFLSLYVHDLLPNHHSYQDVKYFREFYQLEKIEREDNQGQNSPTKSITEKQSNTSAIFTHLQTKKPRIKYMFLVINLLTGW